MHLQKFFPCLIVVLRLAQGLPFAKMLTDYPSHENEFLPVTLHGGGADVYAGPSVVSTKFTYSDNSHEDNFVNLSTGPLMPDCNSRYVARRLLEPASFMTVSRPLVRSNIIIRQADIP